MAETLAGRADAVAAHVAAGDGCAAAAEADELVHETVRAVQAGGVPPAFQEELLSSAQELVQRIECPPAEDDEDEDDDDRPGRGKGRGGGEGKGRGRG